MLSYFKKLFHQQFYVASALQASDQKGCGKRAYQKASVTVEAAFVFPMFLFLMMILLIPLRIMRAQRRMQAVVESVCKDCCQYAYAKYTLLPLASSSLDGIFNLDSQEMEVLKKMGEYLPYLEGAALGEFSAMRARDAAQDRHIEGIHGLKTSCMRENNMIVIRLDYQYRLPFSVFGKTSVNQFVVSSRRAWVGKDGMELPIEGAKKEDDEEMVYVGRTSTRYHLSPNCHYLANDARAVSIFEVGNLRNKSGGKYHACARCGAALGSSTVYIMPSGTTYHSSLSCSAITAYVRKVKKSEVEYLGVCSYCGGVH